MRRTTPRRLITIAAAFILGLGLGAGTVLALGATQGGDQPAAIGGYEILRDNLGDLEIRIWVTTGSHPAITQWLVEETTDRVEITVRERSRGNGPHTMEAVLSHLSWPLKEPLGSRRVVDASSGNDIPPLN